MTLNEEGENALLHAVIIQFHIYFSFYSIYHFIILVHPIYPGPINMNRMGLGRE